MNCSRTESDKYQILEAMEHVLTTSVITFLSFTLILAHWHYLVAEYFITAPTHVSPEVFLSQTKQKQADNIWDELLIHKSPLSWACRGVQPFRQQLLESLMIGEPSGPMRWEALMKTTWWL
jgi:hypothetical protein